jgi:hypothetical protein
LLFARLLKNTYKNTVIFEHGFARIGRMGFATGSQNSVGIGGIRVREEENDVVYLETSNPRHVGRRPRTQPGGG